MLQRKKGKNTILLLSDGFLLKNSVIYSDFFSQVDGRNEG